MSGPDREGYAKCSACGVLRPVEECRRVETVDKAVAWFCLEAAWCRAALNGESGPKAVKP